MASPGNYASFGEASGARPLTLDTLRRVPDYQPFAPQFSSPTNITPALGAFAFTPPQSATDTMSPASAFSNASSIAFSTQESPRRQPYGFPMSSQSQYGAQQPYVPRLGLHDRLSRPLGESAGSPLRTSMSYSGFEADAAAHDQPSQRASSFSEQSSLVHSRPQQHRSLTGPSGPGPGPYGLGFTCGLSKNVRILPLTDVIVDGNMPSYQSSEQQQQQPQHSLPNTDVRRAAGLQPYRRSSSHLAGPPIVSYSPYQPAQFTTPQTQAYSHFTNHFQTPHFQDQFAHPGQVQQQHSGLHQQTSQHYAPIPSQQQHLVPLGSSAEEEGEEGDNSDGGVPVPVSYQ